MESVCEVRVSYGLSSKGAGSADLEYTPAHAAHGLSKGQDGQSGCKDGDEDHCCHPNHKEHKRLSGSVPVLAVAVDCEASQLTDKGGVGEAGLPGGGDGLLAGDRVDNAEARLKLRLAVERCYLVELAMFD